MKILSVTAQKPDSTGNGVFLTELVKGFRDPQKTRYLFAGKLSEKKGVYSLLRCLDNLAHPEWSELYLAGGFCVSCHPFRNNNRGFEHHLREARGLHGVEVLNGSADMEANRTALRYCRELGLKAIGASDAHVPKQVGKYVTWLPERVENLADFVAQLHSCETRPAIWNGSAYDVVNSF